ncbi:MAG: hypothetical protein CMO77_07235 [Verrucomicrobiales bacterium]|nr:hypothetical protein [Verrucomicrobiales bacterium]|tara:strand:+ start:381 stop:623 length:243 start_codon:yes stop_codon:yes gene_type:complete
MNNDSRLLQMNRARVARHKENNEQKGLVRVSVWVPKEEKQTLLQFAKFLKAQPKEQSRDHPAIDTFLDRPTDSDNEELPS